MFVLTMSNLLSLKSFYSFEDSTLTVKFLRVKLTACWLTNASQAVVDLHIFLSLLYLCFHKISLKSKFCNHLFWNMYECLKEKLGCYETSVPSCLCNVFSEKWWVIFQPICLKLNSNYCNKFFPEKDNTIFHDLN